MVFGLAHSGRRLRGMSRRPGGFSRSTGSPGACGEEGGEGAVSGISTGSRRGEAHAADRRRGFGRGGDAEGGAPGGRCADSRSAARVFGEFSIRLPRRL